MIHSTPTGQLGPQRPGTTAVGTGGAREPGPGARGPRPAWAVLLHVRASPAALRLVAPLPGRGRTTRVMIGMALLRRGSMVPLGVALMLNVVLCHFALDVSEHVAFVESCLPPTQLDGGNRTVSAAAEASADKDWVQLIEYLELYSICQLVFSGAMAGMLVGILGMVDSNPDDKSDARHCSPSCFVAVLGWVVGSCMMIPTVVFVVGHASHSHSISSTAPAARST